MNFVFSLLLGIILILQSIFSIIVYKFNFKITRILWMLIAILTTILSFVLILTSNIMLDIFNSNFKI